MATLTACQSTMGLLAFISVALPLSNRWMRGWGLGVGLSPVYSRVCVPMIGSMCPCKQSRVVVEAQPALRAQISPNEASGPTTRFPPTRKAVSPLALSFPMHLIHSRQNGVVDFRRKSLVVCVACLSVAADERGGGVRLKSKKSCCLGIFKSGWYIR